MDVGSTVDLLTNEKVCKSLQLVQAHSKLHRWLGRMFLLDIYCRRKYSVSFVPLMPYSTSNICVTLKSWLRVVQGHWKWRDLETGAIRKLWCGFLFAFYSNCSRLWDIQCQRMAWPWKPGLRDISDLLVENREIFIPQLYFAPPQGVSPSEFRENVWCWYW